MNYLAHLHLGGDAPPQLLGSLYGDFVKGPLSGRWPAQIEAAIRLHRRIDAFTDSHPLQARARARFPVERRRTAGMLLDLFFDHCLARDWSAYASQPLDHFTGRVYREFAVLEQVIAGMQRRLSKPQLLDGSLIELEQSYEPLTEDFRAFYPELMAFAEAELNASR